MKKIIPLMFIMTLIITACGSAGDEIKIAGSSTVFPVTLEAQKGFLEEEPNARIKVEENGTGGGFELFTKGETSINDASREIKDEEIKQAEDNSIEYTEYLLGTDGITVIINKENDWASSMTKEELKMIFESDSKVTKWSDVNESWPNEEIKLYGPTSASGTYDFFCEEIVQEEGEENCSLNSNMSGTENDNEVVTNISSDKNGIGFLGYAYYENNKTKIQEVEVEGVKPNPENIKSGDYILSRPLFIYVNNKMYDENETLNKFVNYYINNAQKLVEDSGYVALTDEELKEQQAKL